MKKGIVIHIAPDSGNTLDPISWDCDRVYALAAITGGQGFRLVFDPGILSPFTDIREMFMPGNLKQCRLKDDDRTYITLHIGSGESELLGYYENMEATVHLTGQNEITETHTIERLHLNAEATASFSGKTCPVVPGSLQYRILKNNLVVLIGEISCQLQDDIHNTATIRFQCWKA